MRNLQRKRMPLRERRESDLAASAPEEKRQRVHPVGSFADAAETIAKAADKFRSAKVNSLPGMAPLVLDSYDDDKLVVIESDDEPLTTVAKAIHAQAGKPDHREYPSVLPINTLQLYVNAEAVPDVKSFTLMTLESSLVSHLKFLISERTKLPGGKFQLRHGLVGDVGAKHRCDVFVHDV